MSATHPEPAHTSARTPEQLARVSDLAAHAARKSPDLRIPRHPAVLGAQRRVSLAHVAAHAARAAMSAPLDAEPVSLFDLADALDAADALLERARSEAAVMVGRANPGVPPSVVWAHVLTL